MKKLTWDNAKLWSSKANGNKKENDAKWSWDCNFKLDFDGDVVSFISRFYPPHYHSDGDYWEGWVKVLVFDKYVMEKHFKCDDLDTLKLEVEGFYKHYKGIIISKFS